MDQVIKKDEEIKELRNKLEKQPPVYIPLPNTSPPYPWIVTTDKTIIDICQHEYPNPWFGTCPAPCKKCGKNQPQTTFYTISGNAS